MDRELAQIVTTSLVRASGEIGSLVPLLKDHCNPQTYETFKTAISRVLVEISLELQNPIFEMYPDLEEEIDARFNKYGRIS